MILAKQTLLMYTINIKTKEAICHDNGQKKKNKWIYVHVYDAAQKLLYHSMLYVPNVMLPSAQLQLK